MSHERWQIGTMHVHNFKSLHKFSCEFAKFTCFIGMNGAGKTTVLQWLDFASALMRTGGVEAWLKARNWEPGAMLCRSQSKRPMNILFEFDFVDQDGNEVANWSGSFVPHRMKFIRERIEVGEDWFEQKSNSFSMSTVPRQQQISFDYQGSVVSQLKEDIIPDGVLKFKHFVSQFASMELLSPHLLRLRARAANGSLGPGGQLLSAFLYELGDEGRTELARQLHQFYDTAPAIVSKSLRSGWKSLAFNETFGGHEMQTEAAQINDGMLRVLAILAELNFGHRVAIFDEIENGINPEIVEILVDRLVRATKQVVVTTHSPMVLNYLEDDDARDGVIYLYKDYGGFTRAAKFFSIPSLAKKLKVMGPGEVFVDTNLRELGKEIEQALRDT